MARHDVRRLTFLLVLALVLALAGGLAACGGSSDNDPPPVAPVEPTGPDASPPPAPATPAPPAAEIPQHPTAPAIPEPVEPAAPAAFPATDESPSPPSALPAAPVEPPMPDPPAEVQAPGSAPPPVLYDTYDLSGAVTGPGHHAFLADPDDPTSVVTTYEGLRNGTTTALLIHKHDGYGASQAALYDAVEPGDLVEWRQAANCFVRYQVTEVQPDPTGTVPQKLLAVAWMTYAFSGCSGPITTTTAATLDWSDLPDLGGTSLTVPIRHGPFQIVPENWTGVTEASTRHEPPAYNRDNPSYTESLAEARRLPYWREPELPDGWGDFAYAAADPEDTIYGYEAGYRSPAGGIGLRIKGEHLVGRGWPRDAAWRPNGDDLGVTETRVIAGRPAQVIYGPLGPGHDPLFPVMLWIFDPATESRYTVVALTKSLLGANVDGVIAIARSLFENPPLLLYDTFDRSGAVTEPGHYAFLADPADPTSAVTTYEELRDGTATALLIHAHDAHGVSQADLYAPVAPGDLFEWRQTADCFVRYQVTAVQPDPTGTVPRKLLTVAWMTYAFAGCTGTIATTTAATLDWSALPDLGGTRLTTPIRHGSWQIVPEGWTGTTEPPEPYHELPGTGSLPLRTTESLAEAQTFLYWRTPALPDGWRFIWATTSGEYVGYGYYSQFHGPNHTLTISGGYFPNRGFEIESFRTISLPNGDQWLYVAETRVIADRPARVSYSPLGSLQNPDGSTELAIYDPATESGYVLSGSGVGMEGADIDGLIAIAASLFEAPNPP